MQACALPASYAVRVDAVLSSRTECGGIFRRRRKRYTESVRTSKTDDLTAMYIVFPRFRIRIFVFALPTLMLMLWVEGIEAFSVLMLSAIAHESGHLLAMKACGYKSRRVDILPMGALIVVPEGIPYQREAIIALGGPLASLFCALISGIWFAVAHTALPLLAMLINLTLTIFNLMPIIKLDGGKALCCYLLGRGTEQKTAERICSAASAISKSLVFALLLIFVAVSGYNLGVVILSLTLIFQLFK